MTQPTSSAATSLVSALRHARNDTAVEDNLRARVQSRLSVSLLGLAPALGGTVAVTRGAGVAEKPGALAAKGASATKSVVLAWLTPVFAVGLLTGVAIDNAHLRSVAPHVSGPAPSAMQPRVSLNPQPEPTEVPTLSPENLEDISDTREAKKLALGGASAASLAEERHLLDDARQALTRGEPQAGLAPLKLHARRFPKGVLTEEREALAVRLLAALGNQPAALARANSFHARFPNSLFTPAVNSAIATFSRRNTVSDSNQ
jgi:hypothetical protein